MIKEWPPCQVFYLESMRTICDSIRKAYSEIIDYQTESLKSALDSKEILDKLQLIIEQAAALSRYFWPSYNKNQNLNEIFKERARFLRERFMLVDSSILRNRELRNTIEHFDESLDLYLQNSKAGVYYPNYIGEKPINEYYTFFRAFFIDTQEFCIFGKTFRINELIGEIIPIYAKIAKYMDNGGIFSDNEEI
jgi:hypothetical protein